MPSLRNGGGNGDGCLSAEAMENGTDGHGFGGIVGRSEAIREQIELAKRYAASNSAVLILGESGTGKEVFANAIHKGGPRAWREFVPLNCAGSTDELIENELFGHESGAYTGARGQSKGLVAQAEGGTLFLDEVDSLSAGAQAKLLRFLQDHKYRPIGGTVLRHANVRIIAASNADLEARIKDGRFREDLYYRLAVLKLRLPPLRERPEDISLLVEMFLKKCGRRGISNAEVRMQSAEFSDGGLPRAEAGSPSAQSENRGEPVKVISEEAMRVLQSHHWPGNVRELENVIERAVVVARGPVIEPGDLSVEVVGEVQPGRTLAEQKRRIIAEFERKYLDKLMAENDWNVVRAAAAAGKEPRTFRALLRKYGIPYGRSHVPA